MTCPTDSTPSKYAPESLVFEWDWSQALPTGETFNADPTITITPTGGLGVGDVFTTSQNLLTFYDFIPTIGLTTLNLLEYGGVSGATQNLYSNGRLGGFIDC